MQDIWSMYPQATCMPEHCFCEAVRYGEIIRQPSNTWSNLAYLVVGILIAYLATRIKVKQNKLTEHVFLSYFYAICCLLLGAGSFIYHASLTYWGQWVDVMGMYLVITFLTLYNGLRIYNWSLSKFTGFFVIINGVLGYLLYAHAFARRYLFGFFVVLLLVSIFYSHRKLQTRHQQKYIYLAAGLFGTAFIIWILDITKILCIEHSLFQGHAVWHILTAISCYFVFRYYQSETTSTE